MVITGKKGILFTVMALTLSLLFLIIFSTVKDKPIDYQNDIVTLRVEELDSVVDQSFSYTEDALEIAAFASLESLFQNVRTSGPLANFTHDLIYCLHNSSGCSNEKNMTILLTNYSNAIKAEKGVDVTINVYNIRLIAQRHFSLEFKANVTVQLDDTYATWNTTKEVTRDVSIIGARDPLYLHLELGGGKIESRRIVVNEDEYERWNITRFMHFYHGKEYVEWTGPCFSDRFEANFFVNSTECGITSVIDANTHAYLKDPVNLSTTHLDHQVIRRESYPCNITTSEDLPRVSIRLVNLNLTLNQEDATRFKLNNNSIWYFEPTINFTTARGCPGFSE